MNKDLTLKAKARTNDSGGGHGECCLNWNVYDISVNCEFKTICMQKMNVIAKISCYFERSVVTVKLRREY